MSLIQLHSNLFYDVSTRQFLSKNERFSSFKELSKENFICVAKSVIDLNELVLQEARNYSNSDNSWQSPRGRNCQEALLQLAIHPSYSMQSSEKDPIFLAACKRGMIDIVECFLADQKVLTSYFFSSPANVAFDFNQEDVLLTFLQFILSDVQNRDAINNELLKNIREFIKRVLRKFPENQEFLALTKQIFGAFIDKGYPIVKLLIAISDSVIGSDCVRLIVESGKFWANGIATVVEKLPPEKFTTLRYFGCWIKGDKLDHFLNICSLVRHGYQKIEVVLERPYYEGSRHCRLLQEISQSFGTQLAFSEIKNLDQLKGEFHIIAAVQLIDLIRDKIAKNRASHCFLLSLNNFFVQPEKCELLDEDPLEDPSRTQMLESLQIAALGHARLSVTFTIECQINWDFYVKLHLIYYLKAITSDKNLEHLNITIFKPLIFSEVTEESLQSFFSMILPKIEITVTWTHQWEQLMQLAEKQDIVLMQFNTKEHDLKIQEMRKHQPEAIQYYIHDGFRDRALWKCSPDNFLEFFTPRSEEDSRKKVQK